MRLLSILFFVVLLAGGPDSAALAKPAMNEPGSWSNRYSKQLSEKCSQQSAKSWLDSYLKIEQEVIKRLQKESAESLAELPDDSPYLDFLETYYPHDLLDLVPTAGVFLDCIDEFSAFKHAKNSKYFTNRAQTWAKCLQSQASASPTQLELAQCLMRLK